MNLGDLANLGQIVGAIGVITLVYLAIESMRFNALTIQQFNGFS